MKNEDRSEYNYMRHRETNTMFGSLVWLQTTHCETAIWISLTLSSLSICIDQTTYRIMKVLQGDLNAMICFPFAYVFITSSMQWAISKWSHLMFDSRSMFASRCLSLPYERVKHFIIFCVIFYVLLFGLWLFVWPKSSWFSIWCRIVPSIWIIWITRLY